LCRYTGHHGKEGYKSEHHLVLKSIVSLFYIFSFHLYKDPRLLT
jgi:hypothetical protein